MSGNNSVTQKNIHANGDVAGRDINNTNIFMPPPMHEDTVLKKLLDTHSEQLKSNQEYSEFSEELNKFFGKALKENLRDLPTKLEDGNREYLIEAALESKERFTKKLHRLCCLKSAQDVYTHLLINIRTSFLHEISSKIKSGKYAPEQVDDLVTTRIISPLINSLGGNSLNIDKDELYGILYFLTGNCHIDWD